MSSIIKVNTIKDTSDNTLLTSSSGNVSISNDLTVDTDTLYVDSTDNRVGIGTSSPDYKLELEDNTNVFISLKSSNTADAGVIFGDADAAARGGIIYDNDDNSLAFRTNNNTERMRIDSSGNVGIGTSSPLYVLDVVTSNDTIAAFQRTTNGGNAYVELRSPNDGGNSKAGQIFFDPDENTIGFRNGTVNRLSVHSSGEVELNTGIIHGGGSGINMNTSRLLPTNSTGTVNDNANDVGGPSNRFDDVYATSGTVNTSDENEKQSIQSLTASEMAVAKIISKLFKTYKWNSAVEEKGDNARTHTGIIAQDVQQAFSDEGLDASNYGMFCSDTWWEKEISVDAVAPQDAVYETQTDDEGNETQVLVQEAIEGKDAYTYMDNKEEATEGYTERTRLGIRYPELLSFVSSAFEQRLTNIETRLTALET